MLYYKPEYTLYISKQISTEATLSKYLFQRTVNPDSVFSHSLVHPWLCLQSQLTKSAFKMSKTNIGVLFY